MNNRREVPRINTNIYMHIFNEQYSYIGFMMDLSLWGAKIKCKGKLEEHDYLKVSFTFDREYVLYATIREKIGDDIYRLDFKFLDFADKISLRAAVEKAYNSNINVDRNRASSFC